MRAGLNILVFNLKTDADDEVLGFTTDWLNELAKHCETVFVITMCAGRLRVARNVIVMSVGQERGYTEARRAARFYWLLAGILRRHRVDACFAHMMPLFALMAWPLLALRGVKIVLWYAHKKVTWTLRLATLIANRVVTSSPSGFQLSTKKLRVIGQGIDTERFWGVTPRDRNRPFTILTVGRISAIKNLHLLIEVVAALRNSHPDQDVCARIVGSPLTAADHEYAERLRSTIAELGLSASVVLAPGKPFQEVHSEYAVADCFVNSSDTDSVDKTVLEAMSSGVPVITSNRAFLDVLGPRLAARWVVPKNDPQVLHRRVAELLEMPCEARSQLGSTLRQIVVRDHSLPALGLKIKTELEVES